MILCIQRVMLCAAMAAAVFIAVGCTKKEEVVEEKAKETAEEEPRKSDSGAASKGEASKSAENRTRKVDSPRTLHRRVTGNSCRSERMPAFRRSMAS